jgi:phage terminase large subunit
VREIQKSLNQSVKRLLETKIQAMNAGAYFEVQDAVIKSKKADGAIIFQGMQNHTADSIKSLEGYDCAWVEEAQSLSQTSLDLLRPTIRKPDSRAVVHLESAPGQRPCGLPAAWPDTAQGCHGHQG